MGAKTSEDAIRYSKARWAHSHCCPAALLDHPRNKSDAQLKLIVEHGGFVGVTTYPSFLPRGADPGDDCVAAIDYVVNLVGEDRVGIGTDFTQDQDAEFFEWLAWKGAWAAVYRSRFGGSTTAGRLSASFGVSQSDGGHGPPRLDREPKPQGTGRELGGVSAGGWGE
ncbi:MAG: hypothetical protein Ct9H300mP16_00470 [Pseudomonadota bacterium]|nr:MAG: hypothetical protein Ct9H300mP16_00470 [Pseudomonadota bacterium]